MSLDFLNSNLLWLLALACIPILLHLFARSKPPVYEFSSVEFLRKIVRETMRLKKPQDYLLLLLRTLAVLALLGVFLRPLLFTQEKLSGLFQKKNLVAIVDASASMSYVEGAQTRFAKACAETSELLSGLSASDRANIIWLKRQPESVFPDELASNLGYLKDQLRRAPVTAEHGSPEKAFALAIKLLEDTEGKREICVISDFQRSAWEGFEPNVPEGVDLVYVRVGNKAAGNRAITKLRVEPANPVVGEDLTILAEVQNFSDESIESTIFSEVGESRESRNISLQPGEVTTASIRHTVAKPGTALIRVSLSEDAFPGDDQRFAVATVRPYLKVGVVATNENDTALLWTRAAQSLKWAVPEWLTPASLSSADLTSFDALFVSQCEIPGDLKLPAGTKLVWLPPSNAALTSAFSAETDPIQTKQETAVDGLYSISQAEKSASLFELFQTGDFAVPSGDTDRERIALTSPPSGKILLGFSDGSPALIRTEANRYLWLAPLSLSRGNFAGSVAFTPLMGELLLADRSAGVSNAELLKRIEYEPGDSVIWEAPKALDGEGLKLSANEQSDEALELRPAGGMSFEAGPFSRPGAFEWSHQGDPLGFTVVNFPALESNLETLSFDETREAASVTVRGGDEVRHLRDGLKLWPWLLAFAVFFFLIESVVSTLSARTI